MNESDYLKAREIIREDFKNHLDINPLHCSKDPNDIDWTHWKEITKLMKEVCQYQIKHGIFKGERK